MAFPASELEWWSSCFSIDDNNDKPIITPEKITVEQSKKGFKDLWK